MLEKILRVILAYKKLVVKKVRKKRSPVARFKARQYYQKHKALLRQQRRKYVSKYKKFLGGKPKAHRPAKAKKLTKPVKHYKAKPSIKKFHVPKHPKPHKP